MNTQYKTTKQKVVAEMKHSCKVLEKSNRTFADIFNVLFDRDGVFAETSKPGLDRIFSCMFREVKGYVETVASGILRKTDAKEEYIALCCENCVEWIVLFWAILKSGNKPYLVNPNHPDNNIEADFKVLGVRYAVTFNNDSRYGLDFIKYYDLLEAGKDGICDCVFGNEIALSTSGTSLKSKICIYSGEEISEQLLNSNELVERNPSFAEVYDGRIKILSVLPFYHIFGLEATHLWFALFGATLVFPERLVPGVLLETVKHHKVTHIFAVPVFWHSIEKNINKEISFLDGKTKKKFEKACETSLKLQSSVLPLGKAFAKKAFKDIRGKLFGDSVQFCISGGSFINASAMRCINALGYQLFNGYGMTEVGIAAVDFSKKPDSRIKPSIGLPFRSVEFKTDDKGVLLIKGKSLCKRIITDGVSAGTDIWFDTGDLTEKGKDGRYYLTGRSSDLVLNENGENYNPYVLEQSLRLPSVDGFCITGDEKNERLVLVLQLPKGFSEDGKKQLDKELDESCSQNPGVFNFKEIYYSFDSLIDGKDIKISRAKLKKKMLSGELGKYKELSYADIPEDTTASQLKSDIKGFFAEVLSISEDEIGDNMHFMNDLGGTSLDYMTLVFRVENHFGISLDAEGEGFNYTLNDFVRKVEDLLSL